MSTSWGVGGEDTWDELSHHPRPQECSCPLPPQALTLGSWLARRYKLVWE